MTTPPRVTVEIREFCARIVAGGQPVYVNVAAVPGEKVNDCFNVVARQITKHGGSIRYGWSIWEWPNVLLQGEFHAVWVSPTNKVFDISPKPDGEKRILFLPAPMRSFDGKHRVPNEWMQLCDMEEVNFYIAVSKSLESLCQYIDPAQYTDEDRRLCRDSLEVRHGIASIIRAKTNNP